MVSTLIDGRYSHDGHDVFLGLPVASDGDGVEIARELPVGHAFAEGGEGDLYAAVPLHELAIRGPLLGGETIEEMREMHPISGLKREASCLGMAFASGSGGTDDARVVPFE